MQYNDIINNGTLVYKSQAGEKKLREWRIEERTCSVNFYKTEPLTELDLVLLRLVNSMEEGKTTREELGLTLGFDVADRFFGYKRYYKDAAEVSLFNKILDNVISWHLLIEESEKIEETDSENNIEDSDSEFNRSASEEGKKKVEVPKYIRLTVLGKKALEMNCKYSFFTGEKVIYCNLNLSNLPEDREKFPFYTSLGLYTEITNVKTVSIFDADTINIDNIDELIIRLNNQSIRPSNIYKAEILSGRKNVSKYVDLSLYKYNDQYYPIIFYNGKVSVEATDILYRSQNVDICNKKIQRALYCKLINNADSVINYNEIKLFEDAIEQDEFELIVKDRRTDWADSATYNYIVTNDLCTGCTWDLISLYCPVNIIINHINDESSSFDMITLSRRLPITYIVENCTKFEWNMNVVMSRKDITKALVQELMLRNTNLSVEWDWEIIEPYLDVDFVRVNIDKINLDFYNLTSWLPVEYHYLICQNYNKNWNWFLFANKSDINLIINNIHNIHDYIGIYIGVILDRILVDAKLIHIAAKHGIFKSIVKSLSERGYLISYNLAAKSNYAWDDELIDLLEQCGILKWATLGLEPGFARYDYVKWDSIFFEKYHTRISSPEDFSHVSEHISDLSLVSKYQDFDWDWKALSRNKNFSESKTLLELGKERISYESWINNSGIELTPKFFESHEHWMRSEENVLFMSNYVNEYHFVIEHQSYPWNWTLLARKSLIANDKRFCESLSSHTEAISNWIQYANPDIIEEYFDRLDLSKHINDLSYVQEQNAQFQNYYGIYTIWDKLSELLTPDFIYKHIKEKWNLNIISSRLIPLIESSSDVLDRCKVFFNWSILSKELSENFIVNNIEQYASYWDWNILSLRLLPINIYKHLKIYYKFWNKDEIVKKVIPFFTKEDINDPVLKDLLNWQIISESISENTLFSILEDKKDFLFWDIISSRISKIKGCDLSHIITQNESVAERLNWNILSSQMGLSDILKYKDVTNAKWEWNTITDRFDTAFIVDNLKEYASYWDWSVILNQKFNGDYIITNLPSVKEAISQLDPDTKEECWKTISSLYTPSELLLLSELNNPLNGYEWNYNHIYQAISDPEEFVNQTHTYIDRKALSACDAVNRMFMYNPDTFVFRTWKTLVKAKLNNPKFEWDYSELTKHKSIQDKNDVFYEINPDRWDWDYISKYGQCLLPLHKGKYLRKYKDRLNFKLISTREDIGIDNKMIDNFSSENWDWKALSLNNSIGLTFDFIFSLKEKSWDWCALSKNPAIKWNIKTLYKILKSSDIKTSVSWNDVISRSELSLDESIIGQMNDICFSWYALTGNKSFRPSVPLIKKALEDGNDINWTVLSSNANIDIRFVREFKSYLDWSLVTSNKHVIDVNKESTLDEFIDVLNWEHISTHIELTTERLVKYRNELDWKIVNNRFNYNELDVTNIDCIKDFVDWSKVSASSIIFTENFLHKYRSRIDWYEFSRNESVDFSAELYCDFAKELNRVKFIDTLIECNSYRYSKLRVYHFSHMFNAIDIIKNRKILSRNKAEASHSLKYDAAGSVVHRTNKAHPYARFYFRPKSPTQFYNECLGWDNSLETNYGKSYYSQACELHLPKCPMPIFFEFDLKEIIAKKAEKCYYSSGNLQTNFASVFKVDDNPNELRTEYLYRNISDAFDMALSSGSYDSNAHHAYMSRIKEQSQQEFLVLDELDFSNLESLRIFCYDEFQKNLLLQYLGEDPIAAKIEVNHSMYSYDKRSLNMTEDDDTITITSDYDIEGCAYMLVKGGSVIKSSSVKKITSSGVIAYPSVTFDKKNLPSEILFVDPNPIAGTKEWLIFSNKISEDVSAKSDMLPEDKFQDLKYEDFPNEMNKLAIQLNKSLFYQHMIYSWHGIAHTSRVLFLSYLIAKTISNISIDVKEGCYYAAIIHDLGKKYDREGEEHGNSSALLYNSKLRSLIPNAKIYNSILEAIRYHSVDDSLCPLSCKNNIIWKILKDADALDRSRFRGKGCDKSYLRLPIYDTTQGQKILALANILPSLTEYNSWNSPYEEIVESIKQYK